MLGSWSRRSPNELWTVRLAHQIPGQPWLLADLFSLENQESGAAVLRQEEIVPPFFCSFTGAWDKHSSNPKKEDQLQAS